MFTDFLQKCKDRIVQGAGFLKNVPVSLYDFHLASDASALTTTISTNPGLDKTDTNMTVLTWAAAKVVAAGLVVQVPDDYDKAKDHLKLKLKVEMSGSTDTPTIDGVLYKNGAGTVDLDPTISAALSDTLAWIEIDMSSNSLKAGDVLDLELTPGTHGTDAINVYAAKLEYRSTLVYADFNATR